MIKYLFERDTWQEVLDSMSKNKLRTGITMIGVWWGILLLIALLGCAKGMENSFNKFFGNFATNSVFIWGQNTSRPFQGFQEGRRVELTLSDAKRIEENVSGVEFVVPRNQNQAQVIRGTQSANFSIAGDFPLLDLVQKKKIIHGRFLNSSDIEDKRKVAVLTIDTYEQLFDKDEQAVGQIIKINNSNFTVIGVIEEDQFDRNNIHIPFTTFQQMYNFGEKIGWLMVTGKSEYNIKQIEQDAKLLLRNMNNIHPKDQRAFGSFNLGKEFGKLTGFLKGMQFLTWFVGIATLIAGVFAIGNILLITVKERTKEIGVRRALGATPFEIK
jgi:putative ABC transport system permease protein